MLTLTEQQIKETYDMISAMHEKHLKKYGVKLPNLYKGATFTKDALVLVYLAQNYPKTRKVSKTELTEFIRQFDPDVSDVQQARHLGAQKGFFILSGTRNDNCSESISNGEYKLFTLEKPYPGFTKARRDITIGENWWEDLKRNYDYRCATCGSKEGEPHRYWKNQTTVLQKGHMDPSKSLEPGNVIPQCSQCNRADRNYWIYNEKGRVIKVANPKVIDSSSEKVQKDIYERLYKKFGGKPPKDI